VGGLSEPQGVLYVPGVKRIFVANANDGSVQLFDGTSFAPLKVIRFASDADNVRYDAASGHIYVGYGDGALAELDQDGNQIGEIKLDAHPESFQLEPDGPCIFVNLPDSRKIAVVDRRRRAVIANWHTGDPAANFPMALDEPHHRLYVVCRSPARLIVLDTTSGTVVATLPAVGDCDDAFYDAKRRRIYATGGEGAISVFHQQDPHHYTEMARIKTLAGARTGFFSPDFDRLYVAVRRHGSHSAAIRVYIPQP
jgi:DNA-binding beta-propeller fold protein YncE